MAHSEIGTPGHYAPATPGTPGTPSTPGTPGAPFLSLRVNGESRPGKFSGLNPCECFALEAWRKDAFPVISVSLWRKVGAEFIGTFMLIFAATATPIINEKNGGNETLLGLALSAGLAVMIIILSTGHISGAHLNPSLTISFAVLRHFPWIQVPLYITAQVVASICASFALKGIFHPFLHGGVTIPSGSYGQAFALEFIISFNLMFVVTAVATDTRAVGELAGIAVGATVTLNILIAGTNTGASMNLVRTLGPAIAANDFKAIWVYMTAPIAGALTGALCYTLVRIEGDGPRPVASFRRSRSSI